jgi:hypothetical protein
LYKKQTHKKGGKPSFLSKLYTYYTAAYKENNCDLYGYVEVIIFTNYHRIHFLLYGNV